MGLGLAQGLVLLLMVLAAGIVVVRLFLGLLVALVEYPLQVLAVCGVLGLLWLVL